MNKADLISEVAKATSTRKDAQAAIDCVLDTITKALGNNEQVAVAGFGTFKVSKRKERTGTNPKTGEKIFISAANVPKFVPGKAMKDALKDLSLDD